MTTLSADEMARIRAECLDNVLSVGASPYFDVRFVYDVIRDYVVSSSVAPTTCATGVTAAGPTVLTLASVSGLAAGSRVQLDVDGSRETVTVRAVSGMTISVICRKTHSGTYPVEVESALTLVRGVLADLSALEQVNTLDAFNALGLRRVDEVEWMERGQLALVESARRSMRSRLASMCGLGALVAQARGTSSFEVY